MFLGPELGEKQDVIETIRGNLTKKYGAPPEETSFYASDTPSASITAFLLNGALFSESRLIFIKNADALKKKDDVSALVDYIKTPASDTTLILISDSISIDHSISRAVEDGSTKNAKRIFWELFDNKKPDWVRSYFRRGGFSIDEDAIDAILELVENNTDALRRECSRLMLFAGGENVAKPAIKVADVEKWLSHTRSESAFTLFSALASGNLSKSLEIMNTLLAAQEMPVSILSGLTWCFKQFRDYCEIAALGPVSDVELKKINIKTPKGRRDYANAKHTFGLNAADSFIALSAEYDIKVRTSGAGMENILLNLYLYKLWSLRISR